MENVKVIAEVGCNHKGDMDIARKLIDMAAICGATVVKFQKRHNRELLSPEEYNRPHPNPVHSYGETYGAHREFLELDAEQHRELQRHCRERGLAYACSVWDLTSAREITALQPELMKVPSAQNTNTPMLEWLCDNFPGELHISVGMTSRKEEEALVALFERKRRNDSLVLYACTSGYPVDDEDVCLLEITRLRNTYADRIKSVGFSGHHRGILPDVLAAHLGAEWIERHFTLDVTWKGTDHSASLEPYELAQTVHNIRQLGKLMRGKKQELLPVEQVQREKLKYGGGR